MSHYYDLAQRIRPAYDIIYECEEIEQTSDRP